MIFPKEILEGTLHSFLFKTKVRSRVIYLISCLSLIGFLSLLPFIKTDIYFSSRGIIRSNGEIKKVVSPNSGYVIASNILYNKSVQKGDTLLILDNSQIIEQLKHKSKMLKIVEGNISDLNYLIFSDNPESKYLRTGFFKSNLLKHIQEKRQIDIRLKTQSRILERQESLFNQKVITSAEIEQVRLDFENLKEQLAFLVENQKFDWHNTREVEKLKQQELLNSLETLNRNKGEFVLIAEETGILRNVEEILLGTFLRSGDPLCQISPDENLITELLVPPSKVGLLYSNTSLSYQVDAFNYRNWGIATGEIIEIGKGVEIINNQPVFKVLASINESQLMLKNGTSGDLRRGLTLTGRFQIAERTLFDLLYDKVDDWLNPGQQNLVANQNSITNVD